MKIVLSETIFNPFSLLEQYQADLLVSTQFGACASFIGTMRDFNEDQSVSSMFLEHYPRMTENILTQIAKDALEKWQLLDCYIVHRVGHIQPSDSIVLIATWSFHRTPALEACHYLIEALKSKAPFWKKEYLAQGEMRWVEKNTPGKETW